MIVAAVIVLVIALAVAYYWYNYLGWKDFASFSMGDSPSWTPDNQLDISHLRFKNCKFTVTLMDGSVGKYDVTPALNSMAMAYKNASSNIPKVLTLTQPLNPFSFAIPGFNDKSSLNPSQPPWCEKLNSCTQDSDCPYGTVTGACNVGQKVCTNCTNSSGSVSVTLTGKVRTI